MAKHGAGGGAPRDTKIIALLNQLGERMIRGEGKNAAFERTLGRCVSLIESLEERAIRAETAEAVLRARQEKLEDEYSAQIDKIEKAVLLADRIEEAIAQQQRLNRRMEKVTQDKVRMIQKLERIEETVIETQDALRATALVIAAPPKPPAPPSMFGNFSAWMNGPMRMQAAGVAALVALAILGGWAASRMQLAGMPQLAFSGEHPVVEKVAESLPSFKKEESVQDQQDQESLRQKFVSGLDAQSGGPAPSAPVEIAQADVPANLMEDDALSAAFEENPDALAAQLNQIEPSSAPADIAPQEPQPSATKEVPPAQSVSAIRSEDEKAVAAFLKAQGSNEPLASRIKPDGKLPSVIKEVERKAFDGAPEAQHDLAAIYTAGHGNVKIDYERASLWFKEAAQGGIANARYNLGVLYHQGLGVAKNIETAIGWYRAAAALGHPEAQYNLGIAHIEGIGTSYDPHRAARYFENAARGGVLEAAYNLGLIYENGLLGTPAPEQALFWYSRASDMGSPEAKAAMTQLAKSLDIGEEKLSSLIAAMKAQDEAENPAPRAPGDMPAEDATPKKEKTSSAAPSASETSTAQIDAAIDADEPPPSSGLSMAGDQPALEKTNPAVIAQIQEQLLRMGLFPGPADGDFTPQTEDAIRAYQTMNSLRRDGTPSEALLVHMLTSDMQSAAGENENGSRER